MCRATNISAASRLDFLLRSSRIRVNLLSYDSKPTDKREQYNWMSEFFLDGIAKLIPVISERDEFNANTLHFASAGALCVYMYLHRDIIIFKIMVVYFIRVMNFSQLD